MGKHTVHVEDDAYDVDVWASAEDDDDYCYPCADWTDDDGHGNCKACGVAFEKIEGDTWATGHTSKTAIGTAPAISSTGDIWGRGDGYTWGGGTSWWGDGLSGSMSSMWGGGYTSYGSSNADAIRMMKHKGHLDSLCKVVDPTVKHMLTFSSHRSGHTNMNTSKIVIDGDLLKESDDNLDITAGLAIHEKLHLIYSQPLMAWEKDARMRLDTTHGQGMLLHDIGNIIEDEYIESQLHKTCKGFVHYIEACKKHYFEDGFESMGKTKEPFADLLNTFMLFVRYPSLIDADRRKRHAPHIRFFARAMSPALSSREAVYKGIENIYTYLLKAFDKMNEGAGDKRLEEAVAKAESRVEEMMEKFGEDGVELSEKDWDEIRSRLKKEFSKKVTDERRDDLADAMSEIADLHKALTGEEEEYTRKDKHLADELMKEIEELEESDYEETSLDKSMVLKGHTKVTWVKAKNNETSGVRYKDGKGRVKKEISKLKKKIQLYGNMEKYDIRNQKQGRIDKRSLHRIPMGRMDLFKTTLVKEDKPLDICLLVDESGSMGSYTMQYARDAAICLKEALSDNERLNLWVYGHSADEKSRGDTEMIEYWSPSMKDRPMVMGGMRARYENRDGNAILAAGERVRRESDQPQARKLMIVMSDGAPSARGYRGYPAVDHVRKCVKSIESRGWDVIQVGFAGSREQTMERMFSNWIYVSETNRLGDQLSKIIRKVLKI